MSSVTKVKEGGLNSHGALRSLNVKLESESDLRSSEMPSSSRVNQQLIDRVTGDPSVRVLLEVVSTGKATRAQSEAFQALTQEITPPSDTGAISDSLIQIGGSKHQIQVRRGPSLHGNKLGENVSSEPAIPEVDDRYPRLNHSSPFLRRLSDVNDVESEGYKGTRQHGGSVPSSKINSLSTRPSIELEVGFTSDSLDFKHQNRIYIISCDRTVKIWDVSATNRCLRTLHHSAYVTSVEVSSHIPGLFATASETIDDAFHIYHTEDMEESNDSKLFGDKFSSARAQKRRDMKLYPECLRWGPQHYNRNLLLAGFRQWDHDDGVVPREAHLCLWDLTKLDFIRVMPSAQSVLAAAWHPHLLIVATGGAPGNNVEDRKTIRVVRSYDIRTPSSYTTEYECTALDLKSPFTQTMRTLSLLAVPMALPTYGTFAVLKNRSIAFNINDRLLVGTIFSQGKPLIQES